MRMMSKPHIGWVEQEGWNRGATPSRIPLPRQFVAELPNRANLVETLPQVKAHFAEVLISMD